MFFAIFSLFLANANSPPSSETEKTQFIWLWGCKNLWRDIYTRAIPWGEQSFLSFFATNKTFHVIKITYVHASSLNQDSIPECKLQRHKYSCMRLAGKLLSLQFSLALMLHNAFCRALVCARWRERQTRIQRHWLKLVACKVECLICVYRRAAQHDCK